MGEEHDGGKRGRPEANTSPSKDGEPGEPPGYSEALGRAVQALRAERGLSRAELAERAGLSYSYLSEIETGKKSGTSSKVLYVLAKALGVSVRELMTTAEERVLPTMMGADFERSAFAIRDPVDPVDASLAPMDAPRTRSSWFRDDARIAAARSANAPSNQGEAIARELLDILPQLSPQDLALVLELARRLRGR